MQPPSRKNKKPGIYFGWWIVLVSYFLTFYIAGTVYFSFTAFIEPIAQEFHWSFTQISLVSTIRGIEIGIFSIFIGFLVERFGAKNLLLFGLTLIGIGLFLFSYTRSLSWFFVSFVVLSLGAGGCTSVVLTTLMANWFNKNMGKAVGIMACGFGSGGLLVPVIVWLIDLFTWRTTLIILAAGIYFITIPLAFFIRNQPRPDEYIPEGEIPSAQKTDGLITENKNRDDFLAAVKNKAYWYFNFAEASRMLVVASISMYLMPYLSGLGYTRTDAGLITAAVPVMSIIGRLGFGWLGDSFNKKAIMIISHLLMGIGILALVFAQNRWLIIPFLFTFPVGFGGSMPLRGLIIRSYFGTGPISRLLGISMGAAASGGMIGPVITGWGFDTYNTYHFVWYSYIGLTMVSAFMISRMQPPLTKDRV